MEIQNISGPDIVQNSANSTPEQTQRTETAVVEQQIVDDQSKGTNVDSYA